MNGHQTPAAFAAGYGRSPYKGGGGEEKDKERNVAPDQNRGLRVGQDQIKILTQIGHFYTEEEASVATLR